MEIRQEMFSGCLLGMAVGDALGYTVDKKTLEQIREAYGPAGLRGYDLVNGVAEISSYTQVGAFACNGLLVGASRGRVRPADCLHFITVALEEWARDQHLPGAPRQRCCWLSQVSRMRQRRCMDARTLDALSRAATGSLERPVNQGAGPGTLTAAVAVGMFFTPERMQVQQLGLLGAQVVALTHGDPMAFLSGAVLAYSIAGILHAPEVALEEQFRQACAAVVRQFGGSYPQAAALQELIGGAIDMALDPRIPGVEAMEQLGCGTAAQVLAGAVYAALASHEDFDAAMIIAVNHSGKSAGVGALTGAILGAKLGSQELPEFYLESLEASRELEELSRDLHNCGPKGWRSRLFDDEWDRKYNHGLPADRMGG